jgi:glycosyltransferase involved in cell wall biosynthesis
MINRRTEMKVLHFASSFFPETGGTAIRLKNLLSDDGHIHRLIVPRPTRFVAAEAGRICEANTIVTSHVDLLTRTGLNLPLIGRYYKSFANCRILLEGVDPNGYDLIHGHNPLDFARAGMKYAGQQNLPFLYEAHMLIYDEVASRKRAGVPSSLNRMAKKIARRYELNLINNSSRVIVQTDFLKVRIERIYDTPPEKIVLVPNGVDTERFQPSGSREEIESMRAKHGWDEYTVILYCGFLDHINGVDFLLHTARTVRNEGAKKPKFIFAGDGPFRDLICRAARRDPERFEYLGVIGHSALPLLYQAADIFVIPRPPSLAAESLIPLKLLEVMAMEAVVLVSDMPAMLEVIEDGQSGFVFRGGDTIDFTRKLGFLIRNAERLTRQRKEARRRVASAFSWSRSRDILHRIYQEHGK